MLCVDAPVTTTLDAAGAARSVQAAELVVADDLAEPAGMQRVACGYWRHLRRATLGLTRSHPRPATDGHVLALLAPPLALMTFGAPRFGPGEVCWSIEGGLLAARPGGELQVTLRPRGPAAPGRMRVHAEVEVRGYHPAIAATIAPWAYLAIQARVHVCVTHGFLRSLREL